jgi:hypothetical protein
MIKRRVVLGLWFSFVLALCSPLARAEESKRPLGAGWVIGYHYCQPLVHAVSLGVILGDASTTGGGTSGPSYEPWPSFSGGGGRGILLQGELAARTYKLSVGYAEGGMLYLPPASFGWAVKASYLAPHETNDVFRSSDYVGAEVDLAYCAKISLGLFQGLDADRSLLVTWSVGIGF